MARGFLHERLSYACRHPKTFTIPDSGARIAALMSGDVDLIEMVPPGDVARISQDGRFIVTSTESLRVIYLTLDFAHDIS